MSIAVRGSAAGKTDMPGAYDQYFRPQNNEAEGRHQDRQVFTVYNIYRLLLGLILLISYFYRSDTSPLGSVDATLFLRLLSGYVVFNVLTFLLPRKLLEKPYGRPSVASIILADILLLVALCYASGGVGSGITPLLILPVASGSLLFGVRISTFFAAVASIALIYGEFYHYITAPFAEEYYVQAGLLGLLLFIAAISIQTVGKRLQDKDVLNRRQAARIQAMQQINEQVIRRMQTGIIVIDQDERLLHCNEAARHLLGLGLQETQTIALPSILHEQLNEWLHHPGNRQVKFRHDNDGPEIIASFTYLQTGNSVNFLVFLEDDSQLSSRAQHLKLMSLGRLTASIAHEVRNPLGAISHAAQLLNESPQLQQSEARLLDIINTHCLRMNVIIQNVLELSRHKAAAVENIELVSWLHRFPDRLQSSYKHAVQCRVEAPEIPVWIQCNQSQLEQVMINLCDNALRYSNLYAGKSLVTVRLDYDAATQQARLDVIDEGPGVPERDVEQVFEPFFTTQTGGTGLGLFICKELCEANRTRLYYQRTADGHSAFRLAFPHQDRSYF